MFEWLIVLYLQFVIFGLVKHGYKILLNKEVDDAGDRR